MPSPVASAKISVMSAWRIMADFFSDRDDGYRDGQYAARIVFVPWRELTDLQANRKRPTLGQKSALTPKRARNSTSPRNDPLPANAAIVINSCEFGTRGCAQVAAR
jgi:hypothetical protein